LDEQRGKKSRLCQLLQARLRRGGVSLKGGRVIRTKGVSTKKKEEEITHSVGAVHQMSRENETAPSSTAMGGKSGGKKKRGGE